MSTLKIPKINNSKDMNNNNDLNLHSMRPNCRAGFASGRACCSISQSPVHADYQKHYLKFMTINKLQNVLRYKVYTFGECHLQGIQKILASVHCRKTQFRNLQYL